MMKTHLVTDLATGETLTVGRDGTRYTAAQVERAITGAKRGDAEAQAIVDNIDLTAEFADADPREVMRGLMDDCPECRAALARGELPTFGTGDELAQLGAATFGAARARWRAPKRRWREQRRRVR